MPRGRRTSRRSTKHKNNPPPTKTPETQRSLARSFLRIPQFLIGVALSGYRSAILPVCTGDLPFSLAFRSACDLRRLPIFRLCLPTQPPTLIGCQILWPAFQSISSLRFQPIFQPSFPANLQLASPADFPAPPSNRPATVATCRSSGLPSDSPPACAFGKSSGSAFPLTSSLRLLPTFQLCLQT